MKKYREKLTVKVYLILLVIFSVFVFGCEKKHKYEDERFLFNTLIKITVYDESKEKAEKAINEAFVEIDRIDKNINNHSKTGEFRVINNNAGKTVTVTSETSVLLATAQKIAEETIGAYDISIAPVFNLWNFNQTENAKLPDSLALKQALENVNYRNIIINGNEIKLDNEDMRIEAGSFLKGYAIERAKVVLANKGIKSAFITAVSSIATIGTKPDGSSWKIGVQNPLKSEEIMKVLNLKDKSVGVSGDYQTYIEVDGKRYHHILDVKTGYPIEGKKMVVIVADSSFLADLYSTAVFTVDINKGLEMVEKASNMECLIIDSNMKEYYSKGFKKYIEK